MNILDSLDSVLRGETKPAVAVEIDTVSIFKAAGVLLFSGVIFVLIYKLIK
ncbi:MAG: hypothetical protein RR393_07980 [Bacteroidales bacterium]